MSLVLLGLAELNLNENIKTYITFLVWGNRRSICTEKDKSLPKANGIWR
jgi:hypothetical protein